MPSLLSNQPVTDAERRANDKHRHAIVALALLVIGVYVYCFTLVSAPVDLLPAQLAERADLSLEHVLDSDGNIDSTISILMAQEFGSNDDERLVFFGILALAFLSSYYLPLAWKQPALVAWTTLGIATLYGVPAMAGLLAAHLCVFLVLHPGRRPGVAALVGALAVVVMPSYPEGPLATWLLLIGLSVACALVYVYALVPLLARPRVARVLQFATVHAAVVFIGVSLALEAFTGDALDLSLAALLFFWQWARLAMYHVDHADGQVPADITPVGYLSVFVSPGVIPNWSWGVTIGQGYAYLQGKFLCEDKNRIVLAGIRLMLIALLYLVLWRWVHALLVSAAQSGGIEVFGGYTRRMVRAFSRGVDVGTVSVLATTLLDLVRFMMFLAGVMHFKVAIWRLCGYHVDPYYDKPWLATNLMAFWTRFAFHYREFLVRVFYYPVFFRAFRRHRTLRIVAASMAAAALGNFIWHVTERSFFREPDFDALLYVFGTWPYFVLLGAGIAVSQVFLLQRRRTRKPWTRDRWFVVDVVAAYVTMQYFALIHIFARPSGDATVADMTWLFLRAFGIEGGGR